MKNDEPGGITAMERLAWQLMYAVCDFADASRGWCKKNNVDLRGANRSLCMKLAHYNIERRIYEARRKDMETSEALRNASAELDALREAGRIMPESVSWPRYEDGGPVRMGEPFVAWDGKESKVRSVTLYAPGQDAEWSINAWSCHNLFGGRDAEHQMHGLRIKRPATKAVGADGREVKVGETVWLAPKHREMAWSTGPSHNLHYVSESEEMTVSQVKNGRDYVVAWMEGEENSWCPASWLTHERPDSWGRLYEDAMKSVYEYWGCIDFCCDKCPALVDGKKPNERYRTTGCLKAQQLDIIARAERLAVVNGDGR